MAKSKNRSVRAKGLRLLREASRNIVAERLKKNRADANVVAIRKVPPTLRGEEPPPGEVVFGMRTGLLGHPTTTVLRIGDERIAGAVEDVKELGEIVTQVGLLTMAALFNYNLAWGPEGLAKAMAKWANVDIEKLKAQAEKEAAEETEAGSYEGGGLELANPEDAQHFHKGIEGELTEAEAFPSLHEEEPVTSDVGGEG